MPNIRFQFDQEMANRAGMAFAAFVEAAKPYLAAVLIVAILLSIWIGARAG